MNGSRSTEALPAGGVLQPTRLLQRGVWMAVGLGALVLVLAVLSLSVGPMRIGLGDLVAALFGGGEESLRHIVLQIRLPRTVGAAVAGAGLALAGCAMQTHLRNALASPFTLGVSQGAVFGAAFAIVVLGAGQINGLATGLTVTGAPWLIAACAFVAALGATLAILALAATRGLSPQSVVLAGVALSALFAAGTMLLQYFATDTQVAATVFWTFGDVGKFTWGDLALVAAVVASTWVWLQARAGAMNAMLWGDDVAASLGVHVRRERLVGLVAATLATAVTVAFAGIIGFLGLLAPHTMRLATRNNHRLLVPFSALFGASLLLFADLLGRTLLQPIVLPVGILTAFAGAPLFLVLLITRRGGGL